MEKRCYSMSGDEVHLVKRVRTEDSATNKQLGKAGNTGREAGAGGGTTQGTISRQKSKRGRDGAQSTQTAEVNEETLMLGSYDRVCCYTPCKGGDPCTFACAGKCGRYFHVCCAVGFDKNSAKKGNALCQHCQGSEQSKAFN